MSFTFHAAKPPFHGWLGPFSPARGTYSGFRFHEGRLGTWVKNADLREFWPVLDSPGVRALTSLVVATWHGGRVLLLPNGFVIKPLQHDAHVGLRVLIGRFEGPVVLESPGGPAFDMSQPGALAAGDIWPGPKTTGLECAIQPDGSIYCDWYHPKPWGREAIREAVLNASRVRAVAFHAARPMDEGGRVRITANGHMITNRQGPNGTWITLYIGHLAAEGWPHRKEWIS